MILILIFITLILIVSSSLSALRAMLRRYPVEALIYSVIFVGMTFIFLKLIDFIIYLRG